MEWEEYKNCNGTTFSALRKGGWFLMVSGKGKSWSLSVEFKMSILDNRINLFESQKEVQQEALDYVNKMVAGWQEEVKRWK